MKGKTVALLISISVVASSLLTFAIVQNAQTIGVFTKNVLSNAGISAYAQGAIPSSTSEKDVVVPKEIDKLLEVYSIIQNSYYDKEKIDPEALIEGAIEGMISTLGDPYTTYMDAEENRIFEESLESSFEGIGTEVMMLNNRVTVVSPFKDSPAEEAGLKPNDQIIKVDGESIEGLSLQEAVKKIRGPKGTKVKLEIIRPGLSEPITLVVVRDTIPIETVYSDMYTVDGKKIGKIEITSFSQNTAKRFHDEFKSLKSKGAKGIVIDVRGNPGGYLESVLSIAENLVPHEGVILQVEDRDGKRVEYKSKLKGEGFPIVLLIDQGSASASEILAGALKDAGFPIVGQNSFGKGTVQVPKPVQDGGSLKITIAKWLTPDGTWIHEKGISPTIEVKQPDYFNAAPIHLEEPLKKDMNGVEILNAQIILSGLGYDPGRKDGYFDQATEDAVKKFQKDYQLGQSGMIDEKTAVKMQDLLLQKIKDPKNDLQLQTALQVLADSLD